MTSIFVKIKSKEEETEIESKDKSKSKSKDKSNEVLVIRKLLSENVSLFDNIFSEIDDFIEYSPDTLLESSHQLYKLSSFSTREYARFLDIDISSVAYNTLPHENWSLIEVLIVVDDKYIFFQRVGPAALIGKKTIFSINGGYKLEKQSKQLTLKKIPDAIYNKERDELYFTRIENLTKIFPGIETLYREATKEEVNTFLSNDFIELQNGFSEDKVGLLNRRRIALIKDSVAQIKEEKDKAFKYIAGYCPELKFDNNKFMIASDKDLRKLLYGFEERYYTTPIGDEKRIANSVIKLKFNHDSSKK